MRSCSPVDATGRSLPSETLIAASLDAPRCSPIHRGFLFTHRSPCSPIRSSPIARCCWTRRERRLTVDWMTRRDESCSDSQPGRCWTGRRRRATPMARRRRRQRRHPQRLHRVTYSHCPLWRHCQLHSLLSGQLATVCCYRLWRRHCTQPSPLPLRPHLCRCPPPTSHRCFSSTTISDCSTSALASSSSATSSSRERSAHATAHSPIRLFRRTVAVLDM